MTQEVKVQGHATPKILSGGHFRRRDVINIGLFFLKITPCPEKEDRQHFGRNFDKFRQLFTIFGTNHPDSLCD